MIYTLSKSIVLSRRALNLKLSDLAILAVLSDGSKSLEQVASMLAAPHDLVRSGINRLMVVGLVENHAGNYRLKKEERSKYYIDDSEVEMEEEEKEKDIFLEVTEEALKVKSSVKLASFWKMLFERTLGRTCPIRMGPQVLGQISSARQLFRTNADLMVCMEYVLWLRLENEPLFPGWDIQDPSIGFFSGPNRVGPVMERIMTDERWATRRAKLNLAAVDGDITSMRRMFSPKEFKELEKYLT